MPKFHGTDPESIERRLREVAEAAEDERHERRAFAGTIALIALLTGVAIAGMAWGFQMDDPTVGQGVFYFFAFLGDLGILVTLLAAYLRRT